MDVVEQAKEQCHRDAKDLLGGDLTTTREALVKLADAYLDAYQWRSEEAQIIERQQAQLQETRALVLRLYKALGEPLPASNKGKKGTPGTGIKLSIRGKTKAQEVLRGYNCNW